MVQLGVPGFEVRIRLQQRLVLHGDIQQVVLGLIVGSAQLRELDLVPDQVVAVLVAGMSHSVGIFAQDLHLLLGSDLGVQHVLGLALFLLQLLEKPVRVFLLEGDGVVESVGLLAFSLKLKQLLVSLRYTLALETVLHLEVLFFDFALLSEEVPDLGVGHLHLTLKVLQTCFGSVDVDNRHGVLLAGVHGLHLLALEQRFVLEFAVLLVDLPNQVLDQVILSFDLLG